MQSTIEFDDDDACQNQMHRRLQTDETFEAQTATKGDRSDAERRRSPD